MANYCNNKYCNNLPLVVAKVIKSLVLSDSVAVLLKPVVKVKAIYKENRRIS